jgi:predicted acetyltransferase
VREFAERRESIVPWILAEVGESFPDYVSALRDYSEGRGLAAGLVPHSTFFLVDASDDVVAVSNLRHSLNAFLSEVGVHIGFGVRPSARRRGYGTAVLRSTLSEARKIGIERAFVTCDKGNLGSERAILKNAGVLQDEIWSEHYARVVRRFWIDTSA